MTRLQLKLSVMPRNGLELLLLVVLNYCREKTFARGLSRKQQLQWFLKVYFWVVLLLSLFSLGCLLLILVSDLPDRLPHVYDNAAFTRQWQHLPFMSRVQVFIPFMMKRVFQFSVLVEFFITGFVAGIFLSRSGQLDFGLVALVLSYLLVGVMFAGACGLMDDVSSNPLNPFGRILLPFLISIGVGYVFGVAGKLGAFKVTVGGGVLIGIVVGLCLDFAYGIGFWIAFFLGYFISWFLQSIL